MGASEEYELAVKIHPEGAEETQQTLDEVQDTFEETADTAGDQATIFDRFARKWTGAMKVITTGLAVAAGALISQIPIVSDLWDGFMAILESVAIKIDQAVRPALQWIVDGLFDIAKVISETEGPLGDAIGWFGALAVAVGSITGIAALTGNLGALSTALAALSGPVGIAIGALALLAAAWATNFGGIRDITFEHLNRIGAIIDEVLGEEIQWMQDKFSEFLGFFEGLSIDWENIFRGIFSTMQVVAEQGFDTVITALGVFLALLRGDWEGAWDDITGFARRTLDRFKGWWKDWGSGLVSWLKELGGRIKDAIVTPISDAATTARNKLMGIPGVSEAAGFLGGFADYIPGLQTGGFITRGGIARLHAGERVVPAAQVDRSGGGPGNIFAERQELVVRFEPARFNEFVSAELQNDPANLGRMTGRR